MILFIDMRSDVGLKAPVNDTLKVTSGHSAAAGDNFYFWR